MTQGIQDILIGTIYLKDQKLPITPESFDLAMKLKTGQIHPEGLPPIKVSYRCDGRLHLDEGRHRIVAFQLLGIASIKADVRIMRGENL